VRSTLTSHHPTTTPCRLTNTVGSEGGSPRPFAAADLPCTARRAAGGSSMHEPEIRAPPFRGCGRGASESSAARVISLHMRARSCVVGGRCVLTVADLQGICSGCMQRPCSLGRLQLNKERRRSRSRVLAICNTHASAQCLVLPHERIRFCRKERERIQFE